MTDKKIAIVGAGLVGSLLSVYLAKRGYKVDVYERRPDMRKIKMSAGRSINLALSTRGWSALEKVGLKDEVMEIAIPMKGRMLHQTDGHVDFQPYGKVGEAIYSVSRGELNKCLMNATEPHKLVDYYFNQKCIKLDIKNSSVLFQNTENGEMNSIKHDIIFGADGAFSRIRYGLQKRPRFNYSQMYLEHGYKELTIPANNDGSHKIEKNALHIWPRKSFMLIALPNLDGSFTCTLFAPFEGENSFESITDEKSLMDFFYRNFEDAIPLMPDLKKDYFENPTSSLVTVRCSPWIHNNIALIGDASHAIVPFYGQGMNSGFEDCRVLNELIDEHKFNWDKILAEFNKLRVPDANAIADLALTNFIEMRDWVADPGFLLRKKIEKQIAAEFPSFLPTYSMVTFSNIRYSEALEHSHQQNLLFEKIMKLKNVQDGLDDPEVRETVEEWLTIQSA
ncbi:MAG: FAD-dependent monooxygenase [Chitinophagales bacterium]|nr:FAD-dependent monooxygenase [Chitinophagales bacterium]